MLAALEKAKGKKSFTELQHSTGLSTPILSEYLKRLQKAGLIERDIDSRKYTITRQGKNEFGTYHFIQNGLSLRVVDSNPLGYVAADSDSLIEKAIVAIVGGMVKAGYSWFVANIYAMMLEQIAKTNPEAREHISEVVKILDHETVTEEQITEVRRHLQKVIPKGKAMISFSFDEGKLLQAFTDLIRDDKEPLGMILTRIWPKEETPGSLPTTEKASAHA